jgi:HSP20 family protein
MYRHLVYGRRFQVEFAWLSLSPTNYRAPRKPSIAENPLQCVLVARIFLERVNDPVTDASMRRLLQLFEDEGTGNQGECAPPVDVLELPDRLEITVDLPGVPATAIRVMYAQGAVVIAGLKLPRVCEHSVAFHLAERRFGRFVRAIGLAGAVDAGRAAATLRGGELRVVLPRIEERRGRDIHIEVTAG